MCVFLVGLYSLSSVQGLAEPSSPKTVAVADFKNTSRQTKWDYLSESIPESINTYFVKTGAITVVERKQLENACRRELKLSLTDIIDPSTAVRLGRIVSAKAIVIGSFVEIGGIIRINARLIDVETSKAITAVQEQGKADEVLNLFDRVAEELKQGILGKGIIREGINFGSLSIGSTPKRAEVFLDGQGRGKTLLVLNNISSGKYQVILIKEGYKDYLTTISVSANERATINAVLKEQTGSLVITSTPEGVAVYVDGKCLGKTKVTIDEILTGSHRVELKGKRIKTWSKVVDVRNQETAEIHAKLEEKPGSILVKSSPSKAKVYLDGEYIGQTILSLKEVKAGKHRIKVSKKGCKSWQKEIVVKGNENTFVSATLEKGPDVSEGMVLIPAGSFMMGSPEGEGNNDEHPQHTVYLDAFYMDKCEVTQEKYKKVMGKNPSKFKGAQNPVERVDWYDAVKFCNKKSQMEGLEFCYNESTWECDFTKSGYRLPTEAEWEYACRAGSSGKWCFGNNKSTLGEYAWYNSNSGRKTHPVGQKKPNAWGLYGMHGNVLEWCHDWHDGDYYKQSPERNPRGPSGDKYRVSRGGSWYYNVRYCRSAYRYWLYPDNSNNYYGFRCARTP